MMKAGYMPNAGATLKRIAKKSGLSCSTVSRALANHPDVNTKTRQMVKEVANSLGYRPNWAAKSLVRGKSNLVAFIVPGWDMWSTAMYETARETLHQASFMPVFYPTNSHTEWEIELIDFVLTQRPGGIVWLPSAESDIPKLAEVIGASKVPLIVLDRLATGCPGTFVCTDDRRGIATGVAHVVADGRRRVALIAGKHEHQTFQWRQEGFRQAVADAGIPEGDATIVEIAGYRLAEFEPYFNAYEAGKRLLSQSARPTAILGSTDEHAWGALDAARDLGISVPHDLRIIGYGDYIPRAITRVSLSTIVQDRNAIVHQSIHELLDQMNGEYKAENRMIVIPTRLEIRDT